MAQPSTPMQPQPAGELLQILTRREGSAIYAIGMKRRYVRPSERKVSDAEWQAGVARSLQCLYRVGGSPVANVQIVKADEQPDGSTIVYVSHDRVLVDHRARGSRGEGHKRRRHRLNNDRQCRPGSGPPLSPQPAL